MPRSCFSLVRRYCLLAKTVSSGLVPGLLLRLRLESFFQPVRFSAPALVTGDLRSLNPLLNSESKTPKLPVTSAPLRDFRPSGS